MPIYDVLILMDLKDEAVKKLDEAGIDIFHIDIMDDKNLILTMAWDYKIFKKCIRRSTNKNRCSSYE